MVSPLIPGISGGVLFCASAFVFLQGLMVGTLTCHDRHQNELCEANYIRTGLAELGLVLAVALGVVAVVMHRRRRPR